MDAVAKTDEPFVAYKFDAGLKGFSTDTLPRVIWRDTADGRSSISSAESRTRRSCR